MTRVLPAAILVVFLPALAGAQVRPLSIPRGNPTGADTPAPPPPATQPAAALNVPPSLADVCNWMTEVWPGNLDAAADAKTATTDLARAKAALEGYLPGIRKAHAGDENKAYAALFSAIGSSDTSVPDDTVTAGLWLSTSCAALVSRRAADLTAPTSPDGHAALVEAQLSIARLKKWHRLLRTDTAATPFVNRASSRLADADEAVERMMKGADLLKPVSAAVFAAATIGSNGVPLKQPDVDPANVVAVPETDSAGQVALIRVETTHWGWEGEHLLDFSIRATFGFRPVDTLAVVTEKVDPKVTPAPPAKTPSVILLTRPALFSSFGFRAGAYSDRNIEVSVVTAANVARITSDKVLVDPSSPETFVAKLPTGAVRTAWAWDLGAEFNLFDNPLRVIHAERGVATPSISFAAGYRWDTRFRPIGELMAFGLENPERRFYFRAMFDALKVFDPRAKNEDARTFDFGFGLEYERPISGSKVPSITRWVVRGDINLISATKK